MDQLRATSAAVSAPVVPPVTTDVDAAVDVLRRGGLVALPTETVYGLGADAANPDAVARVFSAKGRPLGHPLIVHLASADQVPAWTRLDAATAAQVAALAAAFWPGPLTIVVPRSSKVAPAAVGGHDTIALRIPDHGLTLAVLERFGGGVAAPSANRFGKVSPTTAAHVVDDLGSAVDLVLDGGATRVGVESTIIELGAGEPTLLRPGGVTMEQLSEVLGLTVIDGRRGRSRASGMLTSHYAPAAVVEVVTGAELTRRLEDLASGERPPTVGVIAPGGLDTNGPVADAASWLLPTDADGFASGLYDALRRADAAGVERLLVVPPEAGDLLDAVLDRLAKASAPRL